MSPGALPARCPAVEGCAIYDGDKLAVLGTYGGGVGTAEGLSGAAMVGPVFSNADSVDQLTGPSLCVGGSGGAKVYGGGDICFGMNSDGSWDGIWTIWGGVGVGAGVEGHVYVMNTHILAEVDVPNLPSIDDVQDALDTVGRNVENWVDDNLPGWDDLADAACRLLC